MKIIRASELEHDTKMEISAIFVDGFYQWLTFFSKDKAKLTKAFSHMFNLEVFYVALIDNEIAGITACTDGKVSSVYLERKEFINSLGFLRGTIAYLVLKQQFEKKAYPFEIAAGMGMVEFVAVSIKNRGQGVAAAMMKYIFDHTSYREYALEVADTNTNAVKLYEKMGYTEFMRVKQKNSKQSGVNALVYMKHNKREL
ncbi:GNAT family N-acetyltransferase [Paenibacillus sp. 1001270B_150601_E10]|uniref:GNAT family N-acetyltransferase n=1 Tax=Paenibacillus sp. 1001270B_150601_E10 TaxID=2787079 RepID=UPI00189DFD25|nr:GNAT family N-acetyltransferase [Paenibacillus sp. 1001270B_150601_E10]